MPKKQSVAAVVFAAVLLLMVSPAAFAGASGSAAEAEEPQEFLVVLQQSGITDEDLADIRQVGGQVLNTIPQIGVVVVRSHHDSFQQAAGQLCSVVKVAPNIIWEMESPVNRVALDESAPEQAGDNDLYGGLQWDIKRSGGVPETWEMETGKGAVVAVLDTGVYYHHPDIEPNYLYGKSYVVDHTHPDYGEVPAEDENDYSGHGTHVAGSIAAPTQQGRIIGVAPEAGIANYKVLTSHGYGYASWIIEAIVDAADDGVDVINMSLGGWRMMNEPDDVAGYLAYARATSYAWRQNSLVVASSGNSALDLARARPAFHVPSATPMAVSVNATGSLDELASYSNYGASDSRISAPGGGDADIPFSYCVSAYSPLGELEGAMYVWMAGTSMAAPKVSAAAALLYAQNPGIDVSQVRGLLYQTADDIGRRGFDYRFGHGIVDAYRAVTRAR